MRPQTGHAPTDRAGDIDRERITDLLAEAHSRGYLTVDELDTRLAAAVAARTHGDLHALVADLPAHLLAERARRDAAARARTGLRAHLASYVGVMALLVAIWLAVGLAAGAWYPWPIWPALGWGIGVLSHLRAAAGGPAHRAA